VRIYEIDISDPDDDLEFTLCSSLDFPFTLVSMQFIGDRLYGWGYVHNTIDCKALWDYKTKQFVAWVTRVSYTWYSRVSSPESPFYWYPPHIPIDVSCTSDLVL